MSNTAKNEVVFTCEWCGKVWTRPEEKPHPNRIPIPWLCAECQERQARRYDTSYTYRQQEDA